MYDHTKYTLEYRAKNFDTLTLYLPKGEKSRLQKLAKDNGKSLNRYIVDILCGSSVSQQESKSTMSRSVPTAIPFILMDDDERDKLPF